ncbi:hypothetical protein DRF75_01410, partial [Ehrlichia minasensis]
AMARVAGDVIGNSSEELSDGDVSISECADAVNQRKSRFDVVRKTYNPAAMARVAGDVIGNSSEELSDGDVSISGCVNAVNQRKSRFDVVRKTYNPTAIEEITEDMIVHSSLESSSDEYFWSFEVSEDLDTLTQPYCSKMMAGSFKNAKAFYSVSFLDDCVASDISESDATVKCQVIPEFDYCDKVDDSCSNLIRSQTCDADLSIVSVNDTKLDRCNDVDFVEVRFDYFTSYVFNHRLSFHSSNRFACDNVSFSFSKFMMCPTINSMTVCVKFEDVPIFHSNHSVRSFFEGSRGLNSPGCYDVSSYSCTAMLQNIVLCLKTFGRLKNGRIFIVNQGDLINMKDHISNILQSSVKPVVSESQEVVCTTVGTEDNSETSQSVVRDSGVKLKDVIACETGVPSNDQEIGNVSESSVHVIADPTSLDDILTNALHYLQEFASSDVSIQSIIRQDDASCTTVPTITRVEESSGISEKVDISQSQETMSCMKNSIVVQAEVRSGAIPKRYRSNVPVMRESVARKKLVEKMPVHESDDIEVVSQTPDCDVGKKSVADGGSGSSGSKKFGTSGVPVSGRIASIMKLVKSSDRKKKHVVHQDKSVEKGGGNVACASGAKSSEVKIAEPVQDNDNSHSLQRVMYQDLRTGKSTLKKSGIPVRDERSSSVGIAKHAVENMPDIATDRPNRKGTSNKSLVRSASAMHKESSRFSLVGVVNPEGHTTEDKKGKSVKVNPNIRRSRSNVMDLRSQGSSAADFVPSIINLGEITILCDDGFNRTLIEVLGEKFSMMRKLLLQLKSKGDADIQFKELLYIADSRIMYVDNLIRNSINKWCMTQEVILWDKYGKRIVNECMEDMKNIFAKVDIQQDEVCINSSSSIKNIRDFIETNVKWRIGFAVKNAISGVYIRVFNEAAYTIYNKVCTINNAIIKGANKYLQKREEGKVVSSCLLFHKDTLQENVLVHLKVLKTFFVKQLQLKSNEMVRGHLKKCEVNFVFNAVKNDCLRLVHARYRFPMRGEFVGDMHCMLSGGANVNEFASSQLR